MLYRRKCERYQGLFKLTKNLLQPSIKCHLPFKIFPNFSVLNFGTQVLRALHIPRKSGKPAVIASRIATCKLVEYECVLVSPNEPHWHHHVIVKFLLEVKAVKV